MPNTAAVVQLPEILTNKSRYLVMFDAFRQLLRALALPNSPLRRKLRRQRRLT
jgi:hypothetical protein